jgi:hypothetical protein
MAECPLPDSLASIRRLRASSTAHAPPTVPETTDRARGRLVRDHDERGEFVPLAGSYICRVEVTIRAYEPRDAADLADVFFRSVREVALSAYTAAQVRAWAPEPRTAEWARREGDRVAAL